MTTKSRTDLVLHQAWLDQKEQYIEATRLTEIIRREFEQDRNPESELKELNQIMVRINDSDLQIKQLDFDEKSQSAPEFQQLIDELRTMVERLLSQVNLVEQMARDCREKLRPQISTQVKERQMLSAYSQM